MSTARSRWLALAAVVLSSLVLGLDSTILMTALPTLSLWVGATTDQLQWIATSYLLALSGLLIPAGVLGDRLGRRRTLLLALAIFGLSSVAASRAHTAGDLIAMRALMGVSGAFIMPVSLAVIATIFSELERPRAIAIGGAGMFLGLPLGPLVSGWLLTHYDAGSIFLINAPIVLVAMAGVWWWVPESRDPHAPRLDVVGAVLAIAGVTSLVYGVIEQPRLGWTDASVSGAVASGVILLAIFVTWELRSRTPLVDLRFFAKARFSWSIAVSVAMNFALMGTLFVVTVFLQVVEGNDPQATGVRLLPLIAGVALGAVVSDRVVRRLGVRATLVLGLVTCAAGMALMSSVGADSGYAVILIAMPVIGIGNALALFTALNAILDVVPRAQTAAATAMTRTLQQIGSSLGIAVLGSVLNAIYLRELDAHTAAVATWAIGVARGGVVAAAAVAATMQPTDGGALLASAFDAYSTAMTAVLWLCAGIMVLAAALVGVFLRLPDDAAPERLRFAHKNRSDTGQGNSLLPGRDLT